MGGSTVTVITTAASAAGGESGGARGGSGFNVEDATTIGNAAAAGPR